MSADYRMVVGALVAAAFLVYVLLTGRPSTAIRSLELRHSQRFFKTARSNKTPYSDIERDLYIPLGFRTVEIAELFPVLERVEQPSCKKVFDDWLAIASNYDGSQAPVKEVPVSMYSGFTMSGFAYLTYMYFNENFGSQRTHWSRADVDKRIAAKEFAFGYGVEGEGVDKALKVFSVDGKSGLVIGSLSPWVEALCLKHRAAKVITAEYLLITTDHPQLGYVHPTEMAKRWTAHHEMYDFVVSFSSIEHSGLGRFGDPLDPIGDIREMQKVHCLLKKGGLMFLGFPVGADGIAFNAHRYYGRIRLPMMFAGFTLLGIFNGTEAKPVNISQEFLNSRNSYQYVFVIRKS